MLATNNGKELSKNINSNENGEFGAMKWDAAATLNSRTKDRRIWTSGIAEASLNNFTTTNRDEIRGLAYPQSSY